MTRHFQLKVTSPTTNIDVDSVDADEVARIVQLAGLPPSPAAMQAISQPTMPPGGMPPEGMPPDPMIPDAEDHTSQTCSICGSDEHTEQSCPHADVQGYSHDTPADHDDGTELPYDDDIKETADYDYGHHAHSETGEEVDPDTYLWNPKRSKQHFGKSADNTMDDPVNETATGIFHALTEAYREFLLEDRENEAGNLSPLSDPDIEDFDKDPLAGDPIVDDGSHSPFSTVERQPIRK